MGHAIGIDRHFLDANVLVSAAYRSDATLRALWQLSGAVLLASEYVVDEARQNSGETHRADRLLDLLSGVTVVPSAFDPHDARLRQVSLPAKDQPVFLDPLDVNATHLLTGDRQHFGRYFGKRILGLLIMDPNQCLLSAK